MRDWIIAGRACVAPKPMKGHSYLSDDTMEKVRRLERDGSWIGHIIDIITDIVCYSGQGYDQATEGDQTTDQPFDSRGAHPRRHQKFS